MKADTDTYLSGLTTGVVLGLLIASLYWTWRTGVLADGLREQYLTSVDTIREQCRVAIERLADRRLA